jgi:4-hydroxybenzoate polyprenyltransferase
VDHWVKNVFVLPGIVVAFSIDRARLHAFDGWTILAGFAAVCLITSSNYVINEVLDAPFDRHHPTKYLRPAPSGLVSIPLAYAQWILVMVAGLALSWRVSPAFTWTMAGLWVMGCVYNVPPVRSKDVPYLDVVSEAVNNPLRMLAGWFMTGTAAVPPVSLLISYWMIGAYFMGLKRYAEYREIASPFKSASYRKSFAFYTEERLLISIMFYAAQAMLFFGAFIVRYRLELILSFPLVALVMAQYLALSFEADSAAQRPELLYRQPRLMIGVASCSAIMACLLFVDIPALYRVFEPTVFIR